MKLLRLPNNECALNVGYRNIEIIFRDCENLRVSGAVSVSRADSLRGS